MRWAELNIFSFTTPIITVQISDNYSTDAVRIKYSLHPKKRTFGTARELCIIDKVREIGRRVVEMKLVENGTHIIVSVQWWVLVI